MIEDPIVEEIHRIREQLLEECGGDLDKYMDRLKELEKQHPERLIRPEPRGKGSKRVEEAELETRKR
jgi:hypothetical protein